MLDELPPRLIFADVETTGLHSTDHIVSLGVVDLNTVALRDGKLEASCTHLIFDPGKKSHPQAEKVHGYDDWTLRHQEPFSAYAPELHQLFQDPSIVWAHNASFDQAFLDRDFATAGHPIAGGMRCTMQLYRQRNPGRRYGLNAVLGDMGLSRHDGQLHGALEDAWLAMLVYLNLSGFDIRMVPAEAVAPPTNFRAPPPLNGPLPRRSKKAPAQLANAALPPDIPAPDTSGADAYAHVLQATRPLATLMLFVAMADGEVAEGEWSALLALVDETSGRLGHSLSAGQRHEAVASLIDPATAFSVRQATTDLVRDPYARENLGRWMREVTYADGSGSDVEAQAIRTIADAVRAANRATAEDQAG